MPTSPRTLLVLLSLSAAGCLWSGTASAQTPQLNRCAGPGGDTVYTDRPCEAVGARERLPRSAIASTYGLRRGGCARTLQELVYEITAAIDNRDVNRLGSVYHWVGQSPQSGYRILDQLQAIADRPLVDIVAMRASVVETASETPIAAATAALPSDTPMSTSAPLADDGSVTPIDPPAARRVVRRPPVGLRLEQTSGKGSTPARTVFGLRRHLDCWWITL
jgi:hypothetical protein